MTAATIAGLLIQFGPAGIQLIESLIAVWAKPTLTLDEVNTILKVAQTSYDQYIAAARNPTVLPTATG
jgi:hypothetical protein